MPFKRYNYNGVTVQATGRRASSRDDKKYMREVRRDGRIYLVHYGDPELPMRRDEPKRRRAFLERHSCSEKRDPLKPGFWACYDWHDVNEKGEMMADLLGQILATADVQQAIGRAVLKMQHAEEGVLLKTGKRWLARYSNNATDRHRETVTADAHRDFVERFNSGQVDAPVLVLNHDLGLVLGKADRAAVVEAGGVVFPVFSGTFSERVDPQLRERLHGLPMSHGMPYRDLTWRENDPKKGIIDRYNSIELTVMAGAAPANRYTEFLSKGDGMVDFGNLARQLGVTEDVVKALVQGAEADAETIANDGLATKKAQPKAIEEETAQEVVSFSLEQMEEAVKAAYGQGVATGIETARKSLVQSARELSGTQLATLLLGKSAVGVGEEKPAVRELANKQADHGKLDLSAFFGGGSNG